MAFLHHLRQRRSIYQLGKYLPLDEAAILRKLEEVVALTPAAFNEPVTKITILFGEAHEKFWDLVYGKLEPGLGEEQRPRTRKKMDQFQRGAGTVLFFEDQEVVRKMREKYPLYGESFSQWGEQEQGMLQAFVWMALREEGIGANLQHYNPLIDEAVAEEFEIPKNLRLTGQMPFGNILEEPEKKDREDVSYRVQVRR